MAMLVLACHTGRPVTACHVDHGLRQGSDVEVDLVRAAADRFGANVESLRVEIDDGPNLEARAREARLSVLPADALIGHTADDRAETVLLALLRGSGLDGVSAMESATRPILALRRADTHALCASLGLAIVDDAHNYESRFRRVRVRHELMPLLNDIAERDVVVLLDRFADVAGADARLLDEIASQIDPTDCLQLKAAPLPIARRALRSWLRTEIPLDQNATERALAVALGTMLATELPGKRRLTRSGQRLHLEAG